MKPIAVTMISVFFLFSATPLLAAKAVVGKPAPDFTLNDISGVSHSLSKLKGKPIVLEWMSSTCPFTLEHYERGTIARLVKKYRDKIHWLAIDSNYHVSPGLAYSWTMRWKMPFPYLLDKSGSVGLASKAKSTPHMYVIDEKGILRYAGAIDSDASQSDKVIRNDVDEALTAVLAGKEVKTKETKPYGCGIKYAPAPF